jgi:hypothetical protein
MGFDVMGTKTVCILVLSLTLGLVVTAIHAATTITSSTLSTTDSSQSNNTSAESTISGTNGVIVVNGDTVKMQAGKLTLNGVSYGTVGDRSIVRYSVKGQIKKLFVNDVERHPSP